MITIRTALSVASLVALAASPALASQPNLDFGVTDESSYQSFSGAIKASEYVRYDYVNDRAPRVVGATTAPVVYATRNPLADQAQLEAFVAGFLSGCP